MTKTELPPTALEGLSPLNRAAIERLAQLPAVPQLPSYVPIKGQAAVAVILFQAASTAYGDGSLPLHPTASAEDGQYEPELLVLCTTRALHLSSHPGQASLPGGKVDRADGGVVATTAYRETCEEVGLPSDSLKRGECVLLGIGKPFISKTTLLVHPVLFLLPPRTCTKTLSKLYASPDEVSALWSHPLRAFLSSEPPKQAVLHNGTEPFLEEKGEPLIRLEDARKVDTHREPQEAFRTYSDVPWLLDGHYRLHRFRTSHQLLKGLTADVLIHVAAHAYGSMTPKYSVFSPTQASWDDCVAYIVKKHGVKHANGSARKGPGRWGDGESGDSYGSMDLYETVIGTNWSAEESRETIDRDLLLARRTQPADWSNLMTSSAEQQQKQ